ncbi:type II toxin-antitoxin system HicA family toxin [Nocardia sp. NPDC052112]|uniref:type II toxin-antitoxin system HicA family toxin n=1 Tax=Nocardia sp. NPDC052112 TaxID=3155646 RepID=UPI00342C429C
MKVVRALEKWGWSLARIRGSHHIVRHPDGAYPCRPGTQQRDVAKGTLRGILNEAEMSVEDIMKLLQAPFWQTGAGSATLDRSNRRVR